MDPAIDIKGLVGECAQGNEGAFAQLYQNLVDRVFGFTLARTGNREAALELTQDSFVELYKALSRFQYQSDAAFYGFLFTIVRRQIIRYYEVSKKHATVNEEALEQVAASTPGVELTSAVVSALSILDSKTREIIILHHWERFTFAEIAVMIDMTESAVRVRHHRAKAALAAVLAE